MNLRKGQDESDLQYIWRLCSSKDAGVLDMTWDELASILNRELIDDESEYLGESAYRKKYQQAKSFYEEVFSQMLPGDYHDKIALQRTELQKERYKLQTEKLEYNRWLREDARDEMFEEKVVNAIAQYANISPPPREIKAEHGSRAGLLCIADCHFGKEYTLYGIHNEVINAYSPEIFYDRMEQIYNETLDLLQKEGLSVLHIYNLGDNVDGFIRNSQLWSLRWGVIDSAVIFGNYMGDWLRRLSENISIIYHQTDGNHDELRLLDGKKGQHLCESAGKIIKNCIVLKNDKNPNFKFVENKTGLIFDTICGFNILGVHGEFKNPTLAIQEYNNIYDTKISYLVSGHKHHSAYNNCGARKGWISVGSIIGSDDFSMRIRQGSDATATFIVFEDGKGKVDEHTYVLD